MVPNASTGYFNINKRILKKNLIANDKQVAIEMNTKPIVKPINTFLKEYFFMVFVLINW